MATRNGKIVMDIYMKFDDGSEAYLSHYGVAGMKWGVHNEETKRKYGELGTRFLDKAKKIATSPTAKMMYAAAAITVGYIVVDAVLKGQANAQYQQAVNQWQQAHDPANYTHGVPQNLTGHGAPHAHVHGSGTTSSGGIASQLSSANIPSSLRSKR